MNYSFYLWENNPNKFVEKSEDTIINILTPRSNKKIPPRRSARIKAQKIISDAIVKEKNQIK